MTDGRPELNKPLLDPEQLALFDEMGAEFTREILGLFRDECEPRIEGLRKSTAEVDRPETVRLTHRLAGCAANAGGARLHAIALAFEYAAPDCPEAELGTWVSQIEETFTATFKAMTERADGA